MVISSFLPIFYITFALREVQKNQRELQISTPEAENRQHFVPFVPSSCGIVLAIYCTLYGLCQLRSLDCRTNATQNNKSFDLNPPFTVQISIALSIYSIYLCAFAVLTLKFVDTLLCTFVYAEISPFVGFSECCSAWAFCLSPSILHLANGTVMHRFSLSIFK